MKSKLFTLFTLCSAISMNVQAQTTLFNSSAHESTPYRIPAIATMSNGEIIAIADQRPCGADVGNGEVDIYAKISADNGATWTPASTDPSADGTGLMIANGSSSYGYGDAAVAASTTDGKVLVLSVGGSGVFGQLDASDDAYDVVRHYSEDYGRTWTTTTLTSQFKGSSSLLKSKDVGSMFFASGRMLMSKVTPGRIYAALLTSENHKYSWFSHSDDNYNYVFYTEDFGANWKMLGSDYCISGADEAKVAELPNGDIVISSRTTGGRIFNVYSMADGKWGTQSTCTFASGAKSCNGELMIYEGVTSVSTGEKATILLQSLPTGSSRSNVSVFYKVIDENTTYTSSTIATGWTKGIEVDNGASAYSTMTIMPNGEIGFLYEDNYDTSKADGDYSDIVFVPLTVNEITGGAYTYTEETTEGDGGEGSGETGGGETEGGETEEPETPTSWTINPNAGLINGVTYYLSTFSANVTTQLSGDAQAWYITPYDEETVTLTKLGTIIPAGEGVIISSSSTEAITATATDVTAPDVTNNLLVGTSEGAVTVSDGTYGNVYILAKKADDNEVKYYKAANGVTIGANRSYLSLPASYTTRSLNFNFEDDVTAIAPLPAVDDDASAPEYYTLQGVKVDAPTRGIYIMKHHGQTRKVVVK